MFRTTTLCMLLVAFAAQARVNGGEKVALSPQVRKASGGLKKSTGLVILSPFAALKVNSAKDLRSFFFSSYLRRTAEMLRCAPSKVTSFPRRRESSSSRTSTPAFAGVTSRLSFLWLGRWPMATQHDRFGFVHTSSGFPAPTARFLPPASAGKLIALTFDDGPKPYVLMGTRSGKGIASQSLLGLLDRQRIKATFFVMGWRLSKNADEKCRRDDGGVCREAAEKEHRRGHEIENHTYGHGDFRVMVRRYGEEWVLEDIDRASTIIQKTTGVKPTFLRPPDWTIWPELEQKIEARGYHVMTRSAAVPPALRDVDSEDYFCAGRDLSKCPKPSDYDYVLRTIEQRERQGVEQHILVFHELPQSVDLLARLIPELKKRGYRFVSLRAFVAAVDGQP